jgi:formylglycine-generating enzyme required for sulfatase activity
LEPPPVEESSDTPEPAQTEPEVADPAPSNCPSDMVEVAGDFCPDAAEECIRWAEAVHRNGESDIDPNVCEEFRFPSRCASRQRVPMHFCIDRYEWPNRAGEVPATLTSWQQAKASCESVGKRLCSEEEWTLACEGPEMKPYPYGDGYHRDSTACNIDNRPWLDPETTPFEELDKRKCSGEMSACRSDFGVYDMVGNVDEWVYNDRGNVDHAPYVSGLMGGHWVYGIRNRCRAITVSHQPSFSYYVTGARCCSDSESEEESDSAQAR